MERFGQGNAEGTVFQSLLQFLDEFKVMDEFVAVEELHALGYKDMGNLLMEEDSPLLKLSSAKGVSLTVDVERLATSLPLHVMACVASSGAEPRIRYWLRGVRLLHTLSTLAHGYPKLSQVLLQEVKVRMQILDLVTYMLVVLANMEQEGRGGSFIAVLHAALVACSLYLLIAFISHDWLDIAPVLLAHPKVNVFMDASFDAVKRDIVLLQLKLRSLSTKLSAKKTTLGVVERVAQVTSLQCEASLQVLQHLCVPSTFRDRVLGHKELCKNGGILKLVLAVLRLQLPSIFQNSRPLKATISRSKAKALVMMLRFCESDQCSFLDEIAADSRTMQLAEQVALEVLLLVKGALLEDPRPIYDEEEERKNPMGLLHVTALRLADIFSDDSNFRNLVMDHIAPDLATVLAVVPTKFQERWCGGPIARELAMGEQDATLVYDPFEAAGEAMAACAKATAPGTSAQEETFSPPEFQIIPLLPSAYQLRSALLVKLFANFYCFNSEVCPADEKDRFLGTFLRCLYTGPLDINHAFFFLSEERTAVRVCENLHTLYDYVLTLTSEIVVDDDLVLVSYKGYTAFNYRFIGVLSLSWLQLTLSEWTDEFADALHHQICPSYRHTAEAPLLDFVRDGHEQKLLQWKNEREQRERWQRLDQSRQPASPPIAPTVIVERLTETVEENPAELEETPQPAEPKREEPTEVVSAPPSEPNHQQVEEEPEVSTEVPTAVPSRIELEQELRTEKVPALNVEMTKPETPIVVVKEERESESVNYTERDDGGKGEQESGGLTVSGTTPTPRRGLRDREPHSSEHGDESQPKKRKRNIMNESQVSVMEAALQYEPEMQRCPRVIQQWTEHLNKIGPEVAYHQLKNWLNNRKARIARQERDKQRQAEGHILNARGEKARNTRSGHSDPADSPSQASPESKEDDTDQEGFAAMKRALQTPKSPSKSKSSSDGDQEMRASDASKWKVGEVVTLLGKDGDEMADGVVSQVVGRWQGGNLEEQDLCLVQVSDLKVDKTTKLPFPFNLTGTSFEEAETLVGKPRVPWNVNYIVYGPQSTPPRNNT